MNVTRNKLYIFDAKKRCEKKLNKLPLAADSLRRFDVVNFVQTGVGVGRWYPYCQPK